jgi:SAM-dependent methyltransferase
LATPSKFDDETGDMARDHLDAFLARVAQELPLQTGTFLEVGSQDRSTVKQCFNKFSIETFDIVGKFTPTFVGDITKLNESIQDSRYDCVACLNVLEHTLDPFSAIKELRRIIKHGGYLLLSAPLNWRIHGPIPDCWRFTEHGWKVLLKDFDIIEISSLETPDRELFPIHYCLLAQCNKLKSTDESELQFRYI